MLVTTTVKEPKEVSKDIDLPYFSKDKNTFYCINPDESVLKITLYERSASIVRCKKYEFSSASWLEEAAIAQECDKWEVDDAMRDALEFISDNVLTGEDA
jgi:hypothetical protein